MRKLDDLNLWRVFINLAQTRNFSYTAAELGVDVSTVSRMLTTLEKAVGRSLLVRNARPIELKELGQRALNLMTDQIRRQAEIIDELQGPNATMQGVLRLGAPYSLEIEFLGEALLRFQKKFPLVEFRVSGGSGMTELMNRRVDIVFVTREVIEKEDDLVCLPRSPNFYVPIASPEYLKNHLMPESPATLFQHTVYVFDGMTRFPTRSLFKDGQAQDVAFGRHTFVMSNILAIKENVLKGSGICIDMPYFLCATEIAQKKLVPILNGWCRKPIQTYVVCRKEMWNSKSHRVFMRWIQKESRRYFFKKKEEILPYWKVPEVPELSPFRSNGNPSD